MHQQTGLCWRTVEPGSPGVSGCNSGQHRQDERRNGLPAEPPPSGPFDFGLVSREKSAESESSNKLRSSGKEEEDIWRISGKHAMTSTWRFFAFQKNERFKKRQYQWYLLKDSLGFSQGSEKVNLCFPFPSESDAVHRWWRHWQGNAKMIKINMYSTRQTVQASHPDVLQQWDGTPIAPWGNYAVWDKFLLLLYKVQDLKSKIQSATASEMCSDCFPIR